MSTQIYYGNNLAAPSGQPVAIPSFSENSIYFGERWAVLEKITLNGELTGCSYNAILAAKSKLEQIYSSDFQSLSISQDGKTFYYSPYNRVLDIDFNQSLMVGILNYTVSLENYPPELFSGFYAVTSPVNSWEFQDDENKLLQVTHRVSARGLNTTSGISTIGHPATLMIDFGNYDGNLLGNGAIWLDGNACNLTQGTPTNEIPPDLATIINFDAPTWGVISENGTIATISYKTDFSAGHTASLMNLDSINFFTFTDGKPSNIINGNSPLQNAKNYVLNLTGTNSFINPYFANYCSGANLCILSFRENINRFNNEYSVEEKYTLDSYYGGYGFVRYQSNYDCDILKGLATVSLNGEIKACQGASLNVLRNKYNNFDVFSAAVQTYSDACGRIDLNPTYLSSGVSEDNYNKKITFNVNFDNDFTPRTYFDYQTEIKIEENDVTNVEVKGVIKSRGDLATRWQNVLNYYNQQLNLFYLGNSAYTNFNNGNPVYQLNPLQQSYSVTKNQFAAEIAVSTSYNNKDILPVEFKDLDYVLNFKPAIENIQSLPLVNLGSLDACDEYFFTSDLGYVNRAAFGVQGRAVAACTGNFLSTSTALKNLVNNLIINYGTVNKIFIDKNSLTQSNNFQGNDVEFNFQWSFLANQPANSAPFSTVNTLSLN